MKRTNRFEEVMVGALQVFAEYGYKKATVEDIAARLGLTKGALYLCARDKLDLYEQSIRQALIACLKRFYGPDGSEGIGSTNRKEDDNG